MERVTITLHIKGSPLDGNGRWKIQAGVGNNGYVDRGAGAFGTQFSTAPVDENRLREAVRIMCFPMTPAMQSAFPASDFYSPGTRDAKGDALEELMADAAEMGIYMFIEWLQRHPDPTMRERAIRAIIARSPSPMFEGAT